MEIERKFLLSERPDELEGASAKRMEQGYLAVGEDGVEVRIRRAGEKTTLTVKSAPGPVRVEEEIPIEAARFESLWALTDGRRIVKTRYEVPLPGGETAEVDEYHDALDGLLTAEVEFGSREASDAFAPPGWLGAEVTGDDRYANRTLALNGKPPGAAADPTAGAEGAH